MALYARTLILRNCGRFTHVSSDFGSQYHTHTFVTSEALYASLTRGATWRHTGRNIDLQEDAKKSTNADYFFCDYDVAAKPLWFTPGVFVDAYGEPLVKQRGVTDRTDFNVVSEGYPSTGGNSRPHYVPTYGKIEGILPDQRLEIRALSSHYEELSEFQVDQTFLLGKKRTMFQVVALSEIAAGQWHEGICSTGWLEIPPTWGRHFQSFEILAATMRYLVLKGTTREIVKYIEFALSGITLRVPQFCLGRVPGIGLA